ncbi:hypothetical protein BJV77DRAFT_265743 [Russula vinacea]|nr:hypothetical protein BJV77DRAFT_265743 [Russula vinacea]
MSSPLSAQPLKVTTSGSSKGDQGGSRTPVASRGSSPRPPKPLADPADISARTSSQHSTLLEQLDAKFDDMSSQIIDRMMQMSKRVDALEASIQISSTAMHLRVRHRVYRRRLVRPPQLCSQGAHATGYNDP